MATDILNNLADYDVVEEIDESALSTDQAPPPAKGCYQIRVSLALDAVTAENKLFNPEDRFPGKCVGKFEFSNQDGLQKHLYLVTNYEVLNDAGNVIGQQREWNNTMVGMKIKTSAIDTLLKVITGKAGVGLNRVQKVAALYDELASGPKVVEAEIDWVGEITVPDEKKSVKKGTDETKRVKAKKDGKLLSTMTNFPYAEVGGEKVYKPVNEDDDGAEVRTGWVIKEWVAK